MVEEVIVERRGRVVVITIDRPTRRNALGDAVVARLRTLFAELDEDVNTGAIVLSGSPPGFCAGSDLKELGTLSLAEMCAHEARTGQFCREIAMMTTPVISAVEGFALGGGFVLAASCDVVVTARSTRWNLPEVEIGWIPPWGLEAIVARVGPVRSRQLVWGGQPFDGDEAYRLGLADHIAQDGAALDRAVAIGAIYSALPPEAVAATKHYFAVHTSLNPEAGDIHALKLFRDNCAFPTAVSTLRKFGVRA